MPASTRSFEYLECPNCGARYLARDQRHPERLNDKPRWFDCPRCKKRVRSAASPKAASVGSG